MLFSSFNTLFYVAALTPFCCPLAFHGGSLTGPPSLQRRTPPLKIGDRDSPEAPPQRQSKWTRAKALTDWKTLRDFQGLPQAEKDHRLSTDLAYRLHVDQALNDYACWNQLRAIAKGKGHGLSQTLLEEGVREHLAKYSPKQSPPATPFTRPAHTSMSSGIGAGILLSPEEVLRWKQRASVQQHDSPDRMHSILTHYDSVPSHDESVHGGRIKAETHSGHPERSEKLGQIQEGRKTAAQDAKELQEQRARLEEQQSTLQHLLLQQEKDERAEKVRMRENSLRESQVRPDGPGEWRAMRPPPPLTPPRQHGWRSKWKQQKEQWGKQAKGE